MQTTTEVLGSTTSEVEATWYRQRSDSELRSFIERQHSSLSEDFDLALEGLL